MVRPCTITIVALTFSTYACKPFFPECEPPDEAIRALAALCICKSLLHIILRIKNLYKVAFNFLWCSFDFRIILSMYLLQVPKRFEPVQIFWAIPKIWLHLVLYWHKNQFYWIQTIYLSGTTCLLDAVTSSGILKAKQKLGVTFNSDKLCGIDFTKFSKLTMCSA